MLAGFFALLFLVPVDSTTLKVSLPVGANIDRFAVLALVAGWFWFGGDERAFLRTRRSKLYATAAAVFLAIAIASLLVGIDRTVNLGELNLAEKRFGLLGSYLVIAWFTLTALRYEDLRGFCTYIILLGCVMAVGMLVERRTGYNVFYSLSASILKPIAHVATAPTDIHPGFGTDGRPVVVGPTIHGLAATTMLVVAFPLALVRVLDATSRKSWWLNVLALLLLFSGAMATSKRTALVVPVAVLLYVTWHRRRQMLRYLPVALVCMVALVHVSSPGALGKILDPSSTTMSTAHREGDFTDLMPDVLTHPALGRGFGTLDPEQPGIFRINDDEFLDEVWEVGILGLCAYLWMILAPIITAQRAIRGPDRAKGSLALGASAGCVAYLVANALFDAMSFPQAPYMFFFIASVTVIAAAGRDPAEVPISAPIILPEATPPPTESVPVPAERRQPVLVN
jgi:hypothetical protein